MKMEEVEDKREETATHTPAVGGRVVVALLDAALAGAPCAGCAAPVSAAVGFPELHLLRGAELAPLCAECARPLAPALVQGVACLLAAVDLFAATLRDISPATMFAYAAPLFVEAERLYWSLPIHTQTSAPNVLEAGEQ